MILEQSNTNDQALIGSRQSSFDFLILILVISATLLSLTSCNCSYFYEKNRIYGFQVSYTDDAESYPFTPSKPSGSARLWLKQSVSSNWLDSVILSFSVTLKVDGKVKTLTKIEFDDLSSNGAGKLSLSSFDEIPIKVKYFGGINKSSFVEYVFYFDHNPNPSEEHDLKIDWVVSWSNTNGSGTFSDSLKPNLICKFGGI